MLVFIISSTAGNTTEITGESIIPQKVVDEFYSEYPENRPIVLQIEAGRFSNQIMNILKKRLFDDGYTISEKVTDKCLVLRITYDIDQYRETEKRFLSETHISRTINNFYYQLTGYPEGEIFDFQKAVFQSEPIYRKSGLSWYEPLLISAVLGGLVYVMYFGW